MEPIEILGRLVEADRVAGRAETFVLVFSGAGHEIIGHPGWPAGTEAPSDIEVDELADTGWVRITDRDGKSRQFAVTAAGRNTWNAHLPRMAPVAGRRVTLHWSAARPVLQRIFDLYQDAGAPEKGVDALAVAETFDDTAAAEAHIRELVRAGFLDVPFESAHGYRLVRPAPAALQLFAGWPSSAAEDALEGLVEALDSEIEHTTDPDQRSRLERVRSGLLGAARDVAIAYFEKKVMGL